MTPALILLVALVAIPGGLWRVVLGGANKWAAWSQDVRWLRWVWDFTHDEPVLRRSVIMGASPVLMAPAWFFLPWWAAALVTGAASLQWVWPGRDFDRADSLFMGHLPAALIVVAVALWERFGTFAFLIPLFAPVGVAAGYGIARRVWRDGWKGDFLDGWDALGRFLAGASAYAAFTAAYL